MSRARKEAGPPRGRPTSKELPVILPFPGTSLGVSPKPIAQFHDYFIINGIPVHALGERWRAKDAASLGFETYPIPNAPGIVYSLRLETEAEGVLIRSVSRDAYRAMRLALRSAQSQRVVGYPGR